MTKHQTILAFFVIGTVGVLLHFLYEWSGENTVVGYFSAVNESIWEHQKLLFYPAAVYTALEYFISGRRYGNYPIAAAIGIITGIVTIIVLFYTYSGILGFSVAAVDIALYFVGLLVFLLVRNLILRNGFWNSTVANLCGFVLLLVLLFFFIFWTYNAPQISFFQPPEL